jgi:hypothetical protein
MANCDVFKVKAETCRSQVESNKEAIKNYCMGELYEVYNCWYIDYVNDSKAGNEACKEIDDSLMQCIDKTIKK